MELSIWQVAGGAAVIVGLLFSHFLRSPKETIKSLETRIQTLENQHDAFALSHAGSYARLDETVKHLSVVVSKFDQSLGELRAMMVNAMAAQNGNGHGRTR